MSAINELAALCLVALACGLVGGAADAQPTPAHQSQVALNPQPLPPFADRDFWDFDDEG